MSERPADIVVRLMRERPGEWVIGAYTATHRPTGLIMWIRNGPAFCRPMDTKELPVSGRGGFTFPVSRRDQRRIWRAFKKMRSVARDAQSEHAAARLMDPYEHKGATEGGA